MKTSDTVVLGFIVEDSPDIPAVSATHKTVDLYGFASMLLAASQAQARKIETLERDVARLRKQQHCANEAGAMRHPRLSVERAPSVGPK